VALEDDVLAGFEADRAEYTRAIIRLRTICGSRRI